MERIKAYIVIGINYIVACVAAWFVFAAFSPSASDFYGVVFALLLADVAATVIIWLGGIIFRNSSFYDPYWSFIPWLIVLFLMARYGLWGINNIILLAVFGIWSFRLTANWAYTCKTIKSQDWRYIMYREQNSPFMWHVINFFGINLMPTLLVFVALVPAIFAVLGNAGTNILSYIAYFIILLGTGLEIVADTQMHKFKNNGANKGKVMNIGLWKYSRHPNYLGEITVWVGVFVFALSVDISKWFFGVGAVLMFCLFNFISIPLMEKRQIERRADYTDYIKKTSRLLILSNKKMEEIETEFEP